MENAALKEAGEHFERSRAKLLRLAYRMLGSVTDAEDILQDAFLRWLKADRADVQAPEAFLHRTVTRLCLDTRRSARYQRVDYVGPWLPEPLVESQPDDDVTLPLMVALERLTPLERAAFLLHDVFGLKFEEVAAAIGRDTAACRQLAVRARVHVREARPRFQVEQQKGLELAEAFYAASLSGDMTALGAMLAADVALFADGGGKRPAALEPVTGFEAVMKLQAQLAGVRRLNNSTLMRVGFVNGLAGFVTVEADGEFSTTALDIRNGKILTIYIVRNPDKLRHLH